MKKVKHENLISTHLWPSFTIIIIFEIQRLDKLAILEGNVKNKNGFIYKARQDKHIAVIRNL